ncbi:hypothetical protein BH10PSE7_BH10PSE7_17740 [soil metagenome]
MDDRLAVTFATLADPTRHSRVTVVLKHLKMLECAGLIARGPAALDIGS